MFVVGCVVVVVDDDEAEDDDAVFVVVVVVVAVLSVKCSFFMCFYLLSAHKKSRADITTDTSPSVRRCVRGGVIAWRFAVFGHS